MEIIFSLPFKAHGYLCQLQAPPKLVLLASQCNCIPKWYLCSSFHQFPALFLTYSQNHLPFKAKHLSFVERSITMSMNSPAAQKLCCTKLGIRMNIPCQLLNCFYSKSCVCIRVQFLPIPFLSSGAVKHCTTIVINGLAHSNEKFDRSTA